MVKPFYLKTKEGRQSASLLDRSILWLTALPEEGEQELRGSVSLGQHRCAGLLQDGQPGSFYLLFCHVGTHDAIVCCFGIGIRDGQLLFLEG